MRGMRWSVVLGIALSASSAFAQIDDLEGSYPSDERARIELFASGERNFATMIAETPEGGEDRVSARAWTGGLDLCPMAVVRPWVHLGGCLGLHVVAGAAEHNWNTLVAYSDSTIGYLGRAALRSTFLAPGKYVRGGLDLHYRSYLRVGAGRESALEAGVRLGAEVRLGEHRTPFIFGFSFRAPLVVTRSDSTYGWPVVEAGVRTGTDVRPTRDVRILTFGIFVGSAWSL